MNFRNISAWSIRNPVPSLVLFVFLTLAGIVSFMRMDVQNDPDIDFPVVIVAISQPGAAPSELETQVTQRIEAAVRSVQGIDEINSNVNEGNSATWVQLSLGTPIDRALNEIRRAGSAEDFLRSAAQRRLRVDGWSLPFPEVRKVTFRETFRGEVTPDGPPGVLPASPVALEMALHEETERRALDGELAMLEAMWREAEQIAAIADRLPELPAPDPPRLAPEG